MLNSLKIIPQPLAKMKHIVLLFFLSSIVFSQALPQVVAGRIERIENFQSKYVTPRNIDVWLPENYSNEKRYSVLYMHDGQMLYDASTTWNKQEWQVDEVLSRLLAGNKINDLIVIGIFNGGKTRHTDYFPQKPFENLPKQQQDSIYNAQRSNGQSVFQGLKINSDNYLKFIVKELKPFIDKKYSVYKKKQNTFIAGSSMGGLISMYAICEYPSVFGGAACISTHWPGVFYTEKNPIPNAFFSYLIKNLPNPKCHKIYFDFGTATLDAMYEPYQNEVDKIMQQKGYTSKNWITQKFENEDHSELAWAKRLHIPFLFLLAK